MSPLANGSNRIEMTRVGNLDELRLRHDDSRPAWVKER